MSFFSTYKLHAKALFETKNAGKALLLFLSVFCLSMSPGELKAQSSQPDSLKITNTTVPIPDTSRIQDTLTRKTIRELMTEKEPETRGFTMKKSPTAAILWSCLLPGLGQVYNESYWKAPIFAGAAGALIYLFIFNNNQVSKYQGVIDGLDPKNPSYRSNVQYWTLYREAYRDNRDQCAFFLAGVYILAAIDAYVDAHLFDFTTGNKSLGMNISPNQLNGISLNLFLSLGRP